jgi:hypothetical protein
VRRRVFRDACIVTVIRGEPPRRLATVLGNEKEP